MSRGPIGPLGHVNKNNNKATHDASLVETVTVEI